MKEKKVVVSVRCPQWILAEVDKYSHIWRLRNRSKTILFALGFFLGHFTPDDWELYYQVPGSKMKEAWDAFWAAIRSTGVKSNTDLCQE